jgi:hypothetical protein
MVGLFDQVQAMIFKDPVMSVFEIPLKMSLNKPLGPSSYTP